MSQDIEIDPDSRTIKYYDSRTEQSIRDFIESGGKVLSRTDAITLLDEIERLRTQLTLAKAEIDGIHSLLEDVREDYFKERALVDGLTQAILDHIGASLEYNRD